MGPTEISACGACEGFCSPFASLDNLKSLAERRGIEYSVTLAEIKLWAIRGCPFAKYLAESFHATYAILDSSSNITDSAKGSNFSLRRCWIPCTALKQSPQAAADREHKLVVSVNDGQSSSSEFRKLKIAFTPPLNAIDAPEVFALPGKAIMREQS